MKKEGLHCPLFRWYNSSCIFEKDAENMDISLLEETIMLYTETKELQKYRAPKRYGKESRALRWQNEEGFSLLSIQVESRKK